MNARAAVIGVVVIGATCARGRLTDRRRELDQCRVASHSGDELTRCLAVSRNWRADSALDAGLALQHELDSAAHAESLWLDSTLKAQDVQIVAERAARARRWTECALRQRAAAGDLPVSQGEMADSCGRRPTLAQLAAYSATRRPRLSDSVTYWLRLYIPEP